MSKDTQISAGDRVEWTYSHSLNSRSTVNITKTGTVIRQIRHMADFRKGTQVNKPTRMRVLFDGNKNPSTVRKGELVKI